MIVDVPKEKISSPAFINRLNSRLLIMTEPQKKLFHNRVKESDNRAQRNDHNQGPDSNWTVEKKGKRDNGH